MRGVAWKRRERKKVSCIFQYVKMRQRRKENAGAMKGWVERRKSDGRKDRAGRDGKPRDGKMARKNVRRARNSERGAIK